jgi:DMSO/TMAO reductase YedYZ molybdopterin-dependent catalytic subunit
MDRRPPGRLQAAIAGFLAVGVALGLGELIAGIVDSIPSPLAAIGGVVVDNAPPAFKDFAIDVFGTADKTALAIGTTVIALGVGVAIGLIARTRGWRSGIGWFAAFGLAGMLAGAREPRGSTVLIVLATLVTVAAGLATLALLLRTARFPEPTDGLATDPARRRFLAAAAGTGVAAATAGALGRRLLAAGPVASDITLPPAGDGLPPPASANSLAVDGITPIVVPNDEFYRIDTALIVPRVDPDDWQVRVTGMVDEELTLTLADLESMALIERYVTIACVSNEVGGGLVGNAKWTGVRLTDVLERAGVRDGATQIVGRSVDDFTVGFPTGVAFDGREPMIAIGMNDEPLPPRHGYPARLIVPGLYGYVSATKWLAEIELTTWEAFDAYWVPRGWAKEAPIKTQSRIDVPRPGAQVAAGPTTIAGVAWAPTRGISRVEVRVDDGPWTDAELSEPLAEDAWVQWRATVDLPQGRHEVRVRATDGDGVTQTDAIQPPRPDGATGYHRADYTVT